jgi:hypothetical protein
MALASLIAVSVSGIDETEQLTALADESDLPVWSFS